MDDVGSEAQTVEAGQEEEKERVNAAHHLAGATPAKGSGFTENTRPVEEESAAAIDQFPAPEQLQGFVPVGKGLHLSVGGWERSMSWVNLGDLRFHVERVFCPMVSFSEFPQTTSLSFGFVFGVW